jgi:hypothetical protein
MIGAVIGAVFGALAWLITQRRPTWATMVLLPRDCIIVAYLDSAHYTHEHAGHMGRTLEKRFGSGRYIVIRGTAPVQFTAIKDTNAQQGKGTMTMHAKVDDNGPSVTINRGG